MQRYGIELLAQSGPRKPWFENSMEIAGNKLDVPADICEWVSPGVLVSWVQQEVATPENGLADNPSSLIVGILAFAYCRGIYDSEEILKSCDSISEFQQLAKGAISGTDQIRDQRHRKSVLLIRLMVRLLARAVSEKCTLAISEIPRSLKDRLHAEAVQRLQNSVLMDHVS